MPWMDTVGLLIRPAMSTLSPSGRHFTAAWHPMRRHAVP